MIKVENGRVNAKDVYEYVQVGTQFSKWVQRCIEYADLKEGKDFWSVLTKSTFGRPSTEYSFTVEAAKEVCLVSATSKGKELRQYLIKLGNQAENLELVTVKQAALAFKVVHALKYISEQKTAYDMHQKAYIAKHGESSNAYSDFARYRAQIVGWDKAKIDAALEKYLQLNFGYSTGIAKKNMQTKLSVMDLPEAIRVATLDYLNAKGTESELSERFANLCKNLAKELNLEPESDRKPNLFKGKDDNSIKAIGM